MSDYEEIKSRYADELEDVISYVNLSKEAHSPMEKQVLRDIAIEEHEHARMLKHILNESGHPVESIDAEEKAQKALDGI